MSSARPPEAARFAVRRTESFLVSSARPPEAARFAVRAVLSTLLGAVLACSPALAVHAAPLPEDAPAAVVATPAAMPTAASPVDATPAPVHAASAAVGAQVLVMLRSPPAHARVDGAYAGTGYGDAARARAQARIGARIAAAHGFTVITQWPLPPLGLDCVVLSLPPGSDLAAGIAALQTHAEVAWAQPMNEFQAQGHADPLYPLQPAANQWHLDELHALATGRRVRVAVVDSGVDSTHPELERAVETRENFVDGQAYLGELHGTAVAGLVAARADNGIGLVGIAPDARLLALRACWEVSAQQTLCNSLSLAKALNFAIEHHADIINMSLSGPVDPLLGRLIAVALGKRQQVVAAVDAHARGGGFPAGLPGVIAVADPLAPASGGGLAGAWVAPAHDLPTTMPGGGFRMVTGSSFAAGQVSGLLALIAQTRADNDTLRTSTGGSEDAAPLVRLPGGAIDACASLLRAGAGSEAGRATAAQGCRAMIAATGASAPEWR